MAATLLQMKTRIATDVNIDITAESTALSNAIVAAIKFYEKKGRFWFLEENTTALTLSDTTNTVTLPTNFGKLISVRANVNSVWVTDGKGLDGISYAELKQIDRDANLTGAPNKYALFGKTTLRFYPTADDDYSLDIDYIKQDVNYPSADSDTSVWLGDESEDLIYHAASARFWGDRLRNTEKRIEHEQLAQLEWKALTKAQNSRQYKYRLAQYVDSNYRW